MMYALLQDLYRSVDSGSQSGSALPASVSVSTSEPFISGTFEYGVGRTATNRKVYIFLSKAQDQAAGLHTASVSFIGVFKTDKQVGGQARKSSHGFVARHLSRYLERPVRTDLLD